MCRLLLGIFNSDNKYETIEKFRQLVFTKKYTPMIDNSIDADFHMDGIGFAIFYNKEWKIKKSINMDHNFINFLSLSDIIIGHLRNKGSCVGDVKIENTHPFQYKEFIFCHNGKIIDFENNINILKNEISPMYLKEIKGETDSEIIFYILISYYQKNKNLKKSIIDLQIFCNYHKILYYFNFIFSDSKRICMTRLNNTNAPPCSLYKHSQKIIYSSEPLDNHFELISEQTIIEIDIF
jgi:predicted glutamine amidotransferase